RRRPYRLAATLDALVMKLLKESSGPLTAYEIARCAGGRGSAITPAQVYRVLDRLTETGKVQRIELLAAYLPSQGTQRGFLVCRCGRSAEPISVSALRAPVERLCRAIGFRHSRMIFESWGLCAGCESLTGQQ